MFALYEMHYDVNDLCWNFPFFVSNDYPLERKKKVCRDIFCIKHTRRIRRDRFKIPVDVLSKFETLSAEHSS